MTTDENVSVDVAEVCTIKTVNGDIEITHSLLGSPYYVPLDSIKSERDINTWVIQLTEKTWVTTKDINTFIRTAFKAKGYKLF